MRIIELVLHKYKRLLLNNIQTLTLTPKSLHQLILGTNGSGKSSVLYEITPLPGLSNQYGKGGYKRIKIELGTTVYHLCSEFKKPRDEYFFIVNGENLNPGRTMTVQRQLVKEHFHIDQQIHELLVGQVLFTHLSPMKRREWMTKLCHIDFNYALSVFQSVKTQHRDIQGAIKLNVSRLQQELDKQWEKKDIAAIEQQYQELHQELTLLFKNQNSGQGRVSETKNKLNAALEKLHTLSQRLIEKRPTPPFLLHASAFEDIETKRQHLHSDQQAAVSVRNRICTEHDELARLIETLQTTGVDSTQSLEQQIEQTQARITQQQQRLIHWPTLCDQVTRIQPLFQQHQETLITLLKTLPANPNRYFTRDKYTQTQQALTQTEKTLDENQRLYHRCTLQRDDMLALKNQECPKCHYRWVPGRDETVLKRLDEKLKSLEEQIDSLVKVQKTHTEYLEAARHYYEIFNRFRALKDHYPPLNDLFDYLLKQDDFFEQPDRLVHAIHLFSNALEIHRVIEKEKTRYDQLMTLKNQPGELQQKNHLQKRMQQVKEDIDVLGGEIDVRQKTLTQLDHYIKAVKNYLTDINTFEQALGQVESSLLECIDTDRASRVDTLIEQHQLQLATLQQKRNEQNSLQSIIVNLQKTIEQYRNDEKVLMALVKTLSPTEGIIAEYLGGFIEHFIGHINEIIEQIWAYPLIIQACALDKGELDYKFPMQMQKDDAQQYSSDIEFGSEAQVDVINFAFRLVTLSYLGLNHYPIHLDEIGRSFDEQHQKNLLLFLKRFLEYSEQRQMFMVSHFASHFGIFTNADILVIDPTNITVPEQYNTHARLE